MDVPTLLHMFTPASTPSPFDVNMAYDAGFTAVTPYTGIGLTDVPTLVRDVICSRDPQGLRRTGVFIGGRDVILASDMLEAACAAMTAQRRVSLFADPAGAFTTAAATLARIEAELQPSGNGALAGRRIAVMGGTGPVGMMVAVLAARVGAKVRLVSHRGVDAARGAASVCGVRYGVALGAADGSTPRGRMDALRDVHVVVAAAKAATRVLSTHELTHARALLVAADLNVAPPSGIEGVAPGHEGESIAAIPGAKGIGGASIGRTKDEIQHELLRLMLTAQDAVCLDFTEALALARRSALRVP